MLALPPGRDDVGIVERRQVDVLPRLDMGERLDAVAQIGGGFELQRLGGRFHPAGQIALDRAVAAGQESLRLGDKGVVLGFADPPDAGCAAALDLEQQAGPGPRREHGIAAGPQEKGPFQRVQRPVDSAGRGEGPVVGSRIGPAAAIFGDARPAARFLRQRAQVFFADSDVREGFIVPEKDIIPGTQPLDQVRFEEQRLDLGMGLDDLQQGRFRDHAAQTFRQPGRRRIAGDAAAQIARLADIERLAPPVDHAINAGRSGEPGQLAFQIRGAAGKRNRQRAGSGLLRRFGSYRRCPFLPCRLRSGLRRHGGNVAPKCGRVNRPRGRRIGLAN